MKRNIIIILVIFTMVANIYAIGSAENRFDHSEYPEFLSISLREKN
jgi:hypothetical protein